MRLKLLSFDNIWDTTRAGITRLRQLLDRDPALRVIDENPFSATEIVSTFDDALSRIAGELKV